MRLIADTHAHTIASGHAYSSLKEMAYAASKNGLEVLSLTEHAPQMPGSCQEIYFRNFNVIPREMHGVKLLLRTELNIMNPDDGRFPVDYEVLVQTAKETKTLLEINNSSLRPDGFRKNTRENVLQMLELCKQYEVCVTTGSDAHIDVDAGNFSYIKEVLEFCKFPEELVVTTDFNKLKEFLNNYKES